MKTYRITTVTFLCLFALVSCVKDSIDGPGQPNGGDDPKEEEITEMEDLNIPNGFGFETEHQITLSISDSNNGTRYVVLVGGNQVANQIVVEESISTTINIPVTTTGLTFLRRTAYSLEQIKVPVSGNTVDYTHPNN